MIQFLNSTITVEETKHAIQKLKCKKAAGADGISAELYTYMEYVINSYQH